MTPETRDAEAVRRVLAMIALERARQVVKWGANQSHSPERWLVILMEEVGEASAAILEGKPADMLTELSHVAAVATAWMEDAVRHGLEQQGYSGRGPA
jgi:hypothetical protein